MPQVDPQPGGDRRGLTQRLTLSDGSVVPPRRGGRLLYQESPTEDIQSQEGLSQ